MTVGDGVLPLLFEVAFHPPAKRGVKLRQIANLHGACFSDEASRLIRRQMGLGRLGVMRGVLVRQVTLGIHRRHATFTCGSASLSLVTIDHVSWRKDFRYFRSRPVFLEPVAA